MKQELMEVKWFAQGYTAKVYIHAGMENLVECSREKKY